MKVWTEKRTAKDPEAYVESFNQAQAPRGYTARIVSIDGITKSGQKRYTIEITAHRA